MKQETTSRKHKPAKRRPFRVHPFVLVLLAVGSLCFSAAAFMSAYFVPPSMAGTLTPPTAGDLNHESPDDGDDVSATAAPTGAPTAEGRQEGMYTVLLVGTEDNYNTDTMMFARLDTKNRTLNFISIPRDTKVSTDNRSLKKINAAYGSGKEKDDPEAGIENLKKELATLIGFSPDCYAMVDIKAFKLLVDAIDGVEFDVPIDMYKVVDKGTINLKKGLQILNGEQALGLVRYREYGANNKAGVDHDDFGRMQMQQRFLKALAKQTLQLKNVFKVDEFIKIANENLKTDLDVRSMGWFATELMKLDAENIHFDTLPTDSRQNAQYYVYVKPQEALAMINERINPFKEDITSANVKHITQ